jgi:hypothetical protein
MSILKGSAIMPDFDRLHKTYTNLMPFSTSCGEVEPLLWQSTFGLHEKPLQICNTYLLP